MAEAFCPEHDTPLDDYGCWACGHGGPLNDEVFDSYRRWAATMPLFGCKMPVEAG